MMDPEVLERIIARRAEVDGLEEQLVRQMSEVRGERDELAVAVRVWQRMSEQLADERTEAGSPVVQVAGRAVRLVPERGPRVAESGLPAEYQRIPAAVRHAGGPVATRQIGEVLGLDTGMRGKLEPLRGKSTKLADRGWLHKRPDGKFTVRPCAGLPRGCPCRRRSRGTVSTPARATGATSVWRAALESASPTTASV